MSVLESDPGWVLLPRSMAADRDFWEEAWEAERRRHYLVRPWLDRRHTVLLACILILTFDLLALLALG